VGDMSILRPSTFAWGERGKIKSKIPTSKKIPNTKSEK